MDPKIAALIAKRLAAPKSFKVVTTYADGATREHLTETLAQAKNYMQCRSAGLGKALINRETNEIVMVVSIEIVAL